MHGSSSTNHQKCGHDFWNTVYMYNAIKQRRPILECRIVRQCIKTTVIFDKTYTKFLKQAWHLHAFCSCNAPQYGVPSRAISHIVESCLLTKLNGGLSRLHSADEDAVSWLTNYGKWHAYEKKKKWHKVKVTHRQPWSLHDKWFMPWHSIWHGNEETNTCAWGVG